MNGCSVLLIALLCPGIAFCQERISANATQHLALVKTITIKKFTFSYSIDGANLSAKVSFPTRGWVAVGFSPKKRMLGANIIIGSISPEGPDKGIRIDDQYGIAPTRHKPDAEIGGENNIIDGSAIEENGTTTIFFTIPLDSRDSADTPLVPGTETTVIFAAGKQEDLSAKHSWTAKIKMKL
nr:hypothetical protein [uncultured Gammaproteobacteria bacterium]